MAVRQTVRALSLALVLSLAVACGANGDSDLVVEPTPTSDFDAARMKWAATRPVKYEYTLAISCFCAGDFVRPVVIVVDGNTVVSRTFASDGKPVSSQYASSFVTIDGLFDIVLDARNRNAASIVATYHGTRGHPLRISIDYVAQLADEEMYYSASGFQAR